MIVPAICVVMDAGISADKCVNLWELKPKNNVKANAIIIIIITIIESLLGTLILFMW